MGVGVGESAEGCVALGVPGETDTSFLIMLRNCQCRSMALLRASETCLGVECDIIAVCPYVDAHSHSGSLGIETTDIKKFLNIFPIY